jgi:type II secretory ATPase GspE/PulE/Tfp pilus assembly ATPase PilB-like protein
MQSNYDYGELRPMHFSLVRELLKAIEETEEEAAGGEFSMVAEALLRDAVREEATDLHLDSHRDGMLVRMRIDGLVLDGAFLSHEQGQRLSNQYKSMAGLSPVVRFVPEEGRITREVDNILLDLRVAHAPCLRGDKLSIRLFIPQQVPQNLGELGLHEEGLAGLQDWMDNISGMLLVAGPTGSGKTTTLYALLHLLKLSERNVVTIEDPVEYEVKGINHMQVNAVHGLGFVDGMKAMLRLDPDYLMVGEIRDAASAKAAVNASASGHALMSTLHSRDAVGVIDTLRNYGLNGLDISSNLMLVVAQRLVRKLCKQCNAEGAPTEAEAKWLKLLGREVPQKVWHPVGCDECRGIGYHGRTGVFEVWRVDPVEYQLILDGADRRTLYRHLAERGHHFLLDDGLKKVIDGVTSVEELRGMGGFSALGDIDRNE